MEPTKSVETENIDQPKSTNNNAMSEETVVKVMGVMWDKSEDCFKFDLSAFSKQTLSGTLTKRKLLSVTARFYDPLGLLSPLILPFKCMFQEICQLKVEWDEALPEDLTSRWKELVEDIEGVSSFTIPRCIMDGIEAEQVKCIQLHGFADAGRIAYSANVYVRVTTSDGHYSHLLASKTRVAPLKGETIPRLELMACLTLTLLITAVYKVLVCTIEVDAVINWTDSQIVWWWINGESKQFKQFVQNRVENIRSLWSKEHWRYCPSKLNPSDIASRGSKASDLVSSDLWWKGAPFLEKVEKLLRGRDDVVRAAEVVTVDNSLRQVRLKRPIQKLYPLEVNARDEDPVSVVGASVHPGSRNIQVVRDEDIPAVTIAT